MGLAPPVDQDHVNLEVTPTQQMPVSTKTSHTVTL